MYFQHIFLTCLARVWCFFFFGNDAPLCIAPLVWIHCTQNVVEKVGHTHDLEVWIIIRLRKHRMSEMKKQNLIFMLFIDSSLIIF